MTITINNKKVKVRKLRVGDNTYYVHDPIKSTRKPSPKRVGVKAVKAWARLCNGEIIPRSIGRTKIEVERLAIWSPVEAIEVLITPLGGRKAGK